MVDYTASHHAEELQLLRQVVPWPLRITHSATVAIAQRPWVAAYTFTVQMGSIYALARAA